MCHAYRVIKYAVTYEETKHKLQTCQVKSSQVKTFYSGKYTIISYNIGKTEAHLGLFVPLWDEFAVDMWLPLHWPA